MTDINDFGVDLDDIPETEGTFYMTYDGSNVDEVLPWLERNNIPTMKNASNYWKPKEEEWTSPPDWDSPLIVDCGGYNVQLKYGEYPWSIESYNDWLNRNSDRVDWAPVMDYACEDRFNDKWHYKERMEATLENTIEQFELEQDGWKLVPVLQGRNIQDYVRFYDWLSDHGIPTDYVGLGTVCRLSNTRKIVSMENKLRKRTDVDKIHGFGVKIEAYKNGAKFESSDSAAWMYPVSFGDYYSYTGSVSKGLVRKELDDDEASIRRLKTMKNYYKYVKDIMAKEERAREMNTSAMEW